mgnify:CR=1 FL=1
MTVSSAAELSARIAAQRAQADPARWSRDHFGGGGGHLAAAAAAVNAAAAAKLIDGVEYDDNMLTYVLLHELAHVLTSEFGHGAEFIENFKLLLERARQAGHYDPTLSKVENYCA